MKRASTLLIAALLLGVLASCAQTVADKKVVQLKYSGTLADGTVITSSEETGAPLEIMIGTKSLHPALETAIMGLKAGQKKKVEVKAADLFGEYDKELVQEVSKDYLPSDATVGMELSFEGPTGPMTVKILELKSKTAVLDFNHPLAGKDITFDLEVVSIRDPTKDELEKALTAAAAAAAQEQ
jgi:FKBP-type peptidyl-prolyl cis-trans isomerase 2